MSPLVKPVSLLGGVRLPVYSLHFDRTTPDAMQLLWVNQTNIDSLTGDCTFETWVKFDNLDPAAVQMDFLNRQVDGGQVNLFWNMTTTGTGAPKLIISMGGDRVRLSWTPTLDTWYHVAVVVDVSQPTASQYEWFLNTVSQGNGVQESDTGAGSFTWDGSGPLSMGAYSGFAAGVGLVGNLMDVRMWSGKRTQVQIAADWKRFLAGNESGLVANWKLQDGSGVTARDATANNNDMVVASGTPAWEQDVPDWT